MPTPTVQASHLWRANQDVRRDDEGSGGFSKGCSWENDGFTSGPDGNTTRLIAANFLKKSCR